MALVNRRSFIKQGMMGIAGTASIGGFYTWQIEPFWLEFVRKKMPIDHLPHQWSGKTLMQISDIHVGETFDYHFIIDSFQKAQLFGPDLVVYTGDFVTYDSRSQLDQLQEVMRYAVKGKMATVGIFGNHDHGRNWADPSVAASIAEILANEDIVVLRNQRLEIDGLHLIGFDDYWSSNFDPDPVMRSSESSAAHIVLCHNPDVCDLDIWNNYRGWILSGHTHGGQCKPPFLPPPVLPVKNRRYSAGEIKFRDGRTLYINRALGHFWQVRFNVRPEITIFTMESR